MKDEEIKKSLVVGLVGLVYSLVVGLVYSLVVGLVTGFVVGLVYGLVYGLVAGLVVGLVAGLVVGLVAGLVYGLSITFFTNLIGLINLNPEASLTNLIISGILVITIQIIGWSYIKKINKKEFEVRK